MATTTSTVGPANRPVGVDSRSNVNPMVWWGLGIALVIALIAFFSMRTTNTDVAPAAPTVMDTPAASSTDSTTAPADTNTNMNAVSPSDTTNTNAVAPSDTGTGTGTTMDTDTDTTGSGMANPQNDQMGSEPRTDSGSGQ